jgi:hypothetical protein
VDRRERIDARVRFRRQLTGVGRDGQVVDRKSVVVVRMIGIGPTQHHLGAGGDVEAGDGEAYGHAVGGEIAVERRGRGAEDGTREVELRYRHTGRLEIGERAAHRWTADKV